MQFTVDQNQLAQALSMVIRLVQQQNTMAVLGGVQLTASDSGLDVQTTDLFSVMTVKVRAHVIEPGTIVLPASTFNDLIHRLPTATVDVQVDPHSGKAVLKYGRNRATIHGFGNDQLPEFPTFGEGVVSVTLPAGTLTSFARQIIFACSKEESRPILKGIHIELGSGKIVLVSTDGSRLSHAWAALPDYRGPEMRLVLPAKILAEASRLDSSGQPIVVTFRDGFVQFATQDTMLTSRVLDGDYPDYQRVIPQDYQVQIRVPTADLRGSVERAHLIASKDRSNAVKFNHQIGLLQMTASAAEVGQAQEILECDSQGSEMEIMFNSTFIIDALKSFSGEEVMIEFSGVQSPARIRDAANSQYFHILLPLRQLV